MTIQQNITRITNDKLAIKTAIENKGVSVPSSTKLAGYAALVDQIEAQRYENLTVTCSTDQSGVSAAGQVLTINGTDYTVPSSGVVTAKIKEGTEYSIIANSKDGYTTPETQTYTASSNPRSITMQWKKIQHGVFILYKDGSLSNYDTITSGKETVGVVLKNEYVSLVLHPTEGSSKSWATNYSNTISGVITTTNVNTAKMDYAGESNTNAVIASGYKGTAFTFARNASYADGRTGYLPAVGEMEQIRLNATNINTALNLIGGTQLNFSSANYWASTQYNNRTSWRWYHVNSAWEYNRKDYGRSCRSVAAF